MNIKFLSKAIGFSVLLTAPFMNTGAESLTPQQALLRLEASATRWNMPGPSSYRLAYTEHTDGEPRLYVFNRGEEGFVVSSADDRFPSVLGYSDCGTFNPDEASPELLWWLSQYAEETSSFLDLGAADTHIAAKNSHAKADRPNIPELLSSRWNQDYPYNLLCPEQGNGRCVTGCVATAMAQVIRYHAYPAQGVGEHSYQWNGETLSFNYGDISFGFADMLDAYDGTASEEQRQAVAQLMYACGVGVDMNYTSDQSGASDIYIPYALKTYFNYDSGVRLLKRDCFTIDEWEDLLYGELAEQRPVIYGGQAANGGHQFVCDGYEDGYYHINWGWSGMGNGYFLLTSLDPGQQGIGGFAGGYNTEQTMVWGAKPTPGNDDTWYPIYATGGLQVNEVYEGNYAVSLGFGEGGIYNYSPASSELSFYLKFTDEAGEEYWDDAPTTLGFNGASGLRVSGYSGFSIRIPTSLKAGRYKARLAFLTPEGNWQDVLYPITLASYVGLTVGQDGSYSFTDGAPLERSNIRVTQFEPAAEVIRGEPARFDITVENIGHVEFSGTVTVKAFDKGNDSDALATNRIMLSLAAGEVFHGYVDMTYDLPAGEYDQICYDPYDEAVSEPFAFVIEDPVVEASGITLDLTEAIMTEGDTMTLTATIEPEDAADRTLTWRSSDEDVATVEDGTVTALKPGEATVTVSTVNGKEASCRITVINKEPEIIYVESISLNQTEIEAVVGTEIQLIATVLPEDATDKTLIWSSSDDNIASVDQSGLVVVISEGSATITAASADTPGIKAECLVAGISWVEAIESGAATAKVYSIDGLLLKENADGSYLSNLGKGTYIVKIGQKSYKIAR